MARGLPARLLLVSLILLSSACGSSSAKFCTACVGSEPRGWEGAVCDSGGGAWFGGVRHGLLALRGGGEAGGEKKCGGCGKVLVLKKSNKDNANKGRGFFACFGQVRSPKGTQGLESKLRIEGGCLAYQRRQTGPAFSRSVPPSPPSKLWE
jgi:hypothetical protein